MAPREPKMAPSWAQDRPQAPTWPKMGPKRAPRGPQMAPRGPRWPQEGPRWPQVGPKMGPKWGQNRSSELLEHRSRKRASPRQCPHPILRDFGALLGPPGGLLGPSWAHLWGYLRHLKRRRAKVKKRRMSLAKWPFLGSQGGPKATKLGP